MNKRAIKSLVSILIALAAVSGGALYAEESQVTATFLYGLSNSAGIIPISWVKLDVDKAKDEVYVVSSTKINIFNENGMLIYTFNETGELGSVVDVAVHGSGDIFVLGYRAQGRMNIVRCDFRGEPVSTIELKNLPAEYADFTPNRIVVRGASLYLADTKNMKVIVTDDAGVFKNGHDIASLMMGGFDGGDKEKNDYEMTGFSVDKEGNILFTNSSMGRAFKLNSENGQLRIFGRRGSSPGKFGVPTDIVADATGKYILVSDILRCVVMIFDNDFKFYSEFGFRGYQPSNLIGPMFMTVDSKNRVYVSQLRNRGINVYQLSGS